jgi:hypothetical protein
MGGRKRGGKKGKEVQERKDQSVPVPESPSFSTYIPQGIMCSQDCLPHWPVSP